MPKSRSADCHDSGEVGVGGRGQGSGLENDKAESRGTNWAILPVSLESVRAGKGWDSSNLSEQNQINKKMI
jgi:hypothetical protein